MKEKEIKEELELCIRSFLDAKERSKQEGIDHFDELRILEGAFNRLFMSVEHLCNAIILMERGNFSKKHFGDFTKLRDLKEKYKSDLSDTYQTTYNFRSYGDYRKFPEVKDKFNREELKNKIAIVYTTIKNCLNIIVKDIDINEIIQKLDKKHMEVKTGNNMDKK
ncbi:MAG: hypothetical protein ISS82_04865 [Nanoarchaeota archaeon]|nr:hypothetical protein [Nanoarchaeota archaeon]